MTEAILGPSIGLGVLFTVILLLTRLAQGEKSIYSWKVVFIFPFVVSVVWVLSPILFLPLGVWILVWHRHQYAKKKEEIDAVRYGNYDEFGNRRPGV